MSLPPPAEAMQIDFNKRLITHQPGSVDVRITQGLPFIFARNVQASVSAAAGPSGYLAIGSVQAPLVNDCIMFELPTPVDLDKNICKLSFDYDIRPGTRLWLGLGSMDAIATYPRGLLFFELSPGHVDSPTEQPTLGGSHVEITATKRWAANRLTTDTKTRLATAPLRDPAAPQLSDEDDPLAIKLTHLIIYLSGPGALFRMSKFNLLQKLAKAPDGVALDGTYGLDIWTSGQHSLSGEINPARGVAWDDERGVYLGENTQMTKETSSFHRSVLLPTGRYVVFSLAESVAAQYGRHSGLVKKVSIQLAANINGIHWKIAELNRVNDLGMEPFDRSVKPNPGFKPDESRTDLEVDPLSQVAVIEVEAPAGTDTVPVKFELIDTPVEIDVLADPALSSQVNVVSGLDLSSAHGISDPAGKALFQKALGEAYKIYLFKNSRILIVRDNNKSIERWADLDPVLADLTPPIERIYGDSQIVWAAGLKLMTVQPSDFRKHRQQTLLSFAYNYGEKYKTVLNDNALKLSPIKGTELFYGYWYDGTGVGAPWIAVFNTPDKYKVHTSLNVGPGGQLYTYDDFGVNKNRGGNWSYIQPHDLIQETQSGQLVNYIVQLSTYLNVTQWPDWDEALAISKVTQVQATAYLLNNETIKTGRDSRSPVIAVTHAIDVNDTAPGKIPLHGLLNLELDSYLQEPRLFAIAIEWTAVDGNSSAFKTAAGNYDVDHCMALVTTAAGGSFEIYESDIAKFAYPILRLMSYGQTNNDQMFVDSSEMRPILDYDKFSGTYKPYEKKTAAEPDRFPNGGITVTESDSDPLFKPVQEGDMFTLSGNNQVDLTKVDDFEFHVYGDLPIEIVDLDQWEGADINKAPLVVALMYFPHEKTEAPTTLAWVVINLDREELTNSHLKNNIIHHPINFRGRVTKSLMQGNAGGVGLVTGILSGTTNYEPILQKPYGHNDGKTWFKLQLENRFYMDVYRMVDPDVPFDGYRPHDLPGIALVMSANPSELSATKALQSWYDSTKDPDPYTKNTALLMSHAEVLTADVDEFHLAKGGQVDEMGIARLDKGKYLLTGTGESLVDFSNAMKVSPPMGADYHGDPYYTICVMIVMQSGNISRVFGVDTITLNYAGDAPYIARKTLFSTGHQVTIPEDGAQLQLLLTVVIDSSKKDPTVDYKPLLGDDAAWTLKLDQQFVISRLDDNAIAPPKIPGKTKPVDPHPGYKPFLSFGARSYGAEWKRRNLVEKTGFGFEIDALTKDGGEAPRSVITEISSDNNLFLLDEGQYAIGLRESATIYNEPKPFTDPPKLFAGFKETHPNVLAIMFQVMIIGREWDPSANGGQGFWGTPKIVATSPGNTGALQKVAGTDNPSELDTMLSPYCLAFRTWRPKSANTYYNMLLEPVVNVGPPVGGFPRIHTVVLKVAQYLTKTSDPLPDDWTIQSYQTWGVLVYKKEGGN